MIEKRLKVEIRVGTRGSKLALIQTNWVIETLQMAYPEVHFTTQIIQTKGDAILHMPLDKIGDKGLFVKEIEQRLIERKIDFAVHSMKDMPGDLPEGLCFAKVPKRADRRDALILREGLTTLDALPQGAKIGTGSKRRKYQLLALRPDLQIVPIRGNIETRIAKIKTEGLDGIVLAAAGLQRADLTAHISYLLSEEEMVPAPAQGALAIQLRCEDKALYDMLGALASPQDMIEVAAERAFLQGVEGSCHLPIGASAKQLGDTLTLTALFGDETGAYLNRQTHTAPCITEGDAKAIGTQLASTMMEVMKHEGW